MTIQEILRKFFTKTATEEDDKYYRENFMSAEEKEVGRKTISESRMKMVFIPLQGISLN